MPYLVNVENIKKRKFFLSFLSLYYTKDYETTWTKDETYHWHKCTGCDTGIKDKATHTPNRTEATETEAVKCTICDYVITPALSHMHDLTFVAEVSATCSNTGTKAHYRIARA